MRFSIFLIGICHFLLLNCAYTQKPNARNQNLIYIDGQGIIRYSVSKQPAYFFGINYTVPFAHGYRAHKALAKDLKTAIDNDVYHFARLGLDAFRVHMWDVELSDSAGNLQVNEHLDLFDYLIFKLKERNIRILLTPIAFWGNGYPEPDDKTNGFSYVFTKGGAVVNEIAIKAQENYLPQIFNHVNPYTHLAYKNDPDIIAAEINNEPHHSGPKKKTNEYVNRLAAAIRQTGFNKPLFYNISESPTYADAVAASTVDGFSFQWYPTGLVAGYQLKGNYLPNVDTYHIPFDTIPAFHHKAKMVYEFDAGDVLYSYMYPAIARSFKAAGFQWATQFAYDPLATAYANTEYQTHYLNLAYTPSKAISLLIASKAFHNLPLNKNYGNYPADTLFGDFRVSSKNDLSEMNSSSEFYYSNSTQTNPKNLQTLVHVAGVGNSPVVKYEGNGAYFLDKLEDGVWRLEVMPDIIQVGDPFKKPSLQKEVTRLEYQHRFFTIHISDLNEFYVKGINDGNNFKTKSANHSFSVVPGTYLLTRKENVGTATMHVKDFNIKVAEFIAPSPISSDILVNHIPSKVIAANTRYFIKAIASGVNDSSLIYVEVQSTNGWKNINMQLSKPGQFEAEIPADVLMPGKLNYRIIVKDKNEFYTYPGNVHGDPYKWDYLNEKTYTTMVGSGETPLVLFNANDNENKIVYYNPDWRNHSFSIMPTSLPGQMALQARVTGMPAGVQVYTDDIMNQSSNEATRFTRLHTQLNMIEGGHVKIILVNKDAVGYAYDLPVTEGWQDVDIPLKEFKQDSILLLPRPYPGFQPLWFKANINSDLVLNDLEKLQVIFYPGNDLAKNTTFQITTIWLSR